MYHFPNSIDKTATATATKNYIDDEEAGECNCIAMHLKIELMMMVQGSVIAWWIFVQGGAGQVDVQAQIPYSKFLQRYPTVSSYKDTIQQVFT